MIYEGSQVVSVEMVESGISSDDSSKLVLALFNSRVGITF